MVTYRNKTSAEMAGAAQIAEIEAFVGKEAADKLVEKYGPYVYELYKRAKAAPAYWTKYADDHQFRSSRNTLKYFAEKELSNAQIAEIIKVPEITVAAQRAAWSIQQGMASVGQEPIKSVQVSQLKFDSRVDESLKKYPQKAVQAQTQVQPQAQTQAQPSATTGKKLIVGDSRTVGMATTAGIRYNRKIDSSDGQGNRWFAEEGKGLSWMKKNEDRINTLASTCDTVVINLGVNDIGLNPEVAAKQYIEYINKVAREWKAQGKEVIFTSVNPVEDDKTFIKNRNIEKFNRLVKEGLSSDVTFVDTYSDLKNNPRYRLSDGLHGSFDTARDTLNNNMNNVLKMSTNIPSKVLSGNSPAEKSSRESSLYSYVPSTTQASQDITISPRDVKLSSPSVVESVANIGGVEVKSDSITATSVTREIYAKDSNVGVISGTNVDKTGQRYWGIVQHNYTGAQNIALYAATHPEYSNIAEHFFDTSKPGYQQAVQAFKNQEKNGPGIYNINWNTKKGSAIRERLVQYIRSDYAQKFQAEGKTNPQQFTQLQRDVTTNVTATSYKWQPIVDELKRKGIEPTDVSPTVWGTLLSVGIARGNITGAKDLFVGKSLEQINSPEMIDKIREKFPGVFRTSHKNEMAAYNYAKEHVRDKMSVSQAKELSAMLRDPSVFEYYLAHMPEDQKVKIAALRQKNNGNKAYAQAQMSSGGRGA